MNKKGKFNVPIGTKVYPLRESAEFACWSKLLSSADIVVSDFEPIVDRTSEGDFLFLDPPYTVNHNSNGFIEYNEEIFSWSDQVRLHASVLRANERGADFLLTNADHKTLRDLYANDCELRSVKRGSEMAGKVKFRGNTTELVVTPH